MHLTMPDVPLQQSALLLPLLIMITHVYQILGSKSNSFSTKSWHKYLPQPTSCYWPEDAHVLSPRLEILVEVDYFHHRAATYELELDSKFPL
jgi:hypothetical protein